MGSLQSIEKALTSFYFTFVLCISEECTKDTVIFPSECVFVTVSYIYSLQTTWRGPGILCVEPAPQPPLLPQLPFHAPPRAPGWSQDRPWRAGSHSRHWSLCPGEGTRLPWQPLRFFASNWMPWSLDSAAAGARASVVCVGMGCR